MKTPAEIRIDSAARVLTLHWPDGGVLRITHERLRRACPCAGCRAARLAGHDAAPDPIVTVTGIEPMGYGVQLSFSDGHDRGIFPWSYLESVAHTPPPHGAPRCACP
ncbi:MAG: gamma-butyrobetaine hydroxylase-like domain-containing protein [Trinickia sp.]|jgi:DUF971 family protein